MCASLHIIRLTPSEIRVKAESFKGRLKWTNRLLTPRIEINPACIIEFEQPNGLRRLAKAFHLRHVFNTELFNFDSNHSQRFTLYWQIQEKKVSTEFRINRETMPIYWTLILQISLWSLIQGIFVRVQLFSSLLESGCKTLFCLLEKKENKSHLNPDVGWEIKLLFCLLPHRNLLLWLEKREIKAWSAMWSRVKRLHPSLMCTTTTALHGMFTHTLLILCTLCDYVVISQLSREAFQIESDTFAIDGLKRAHAATVAVELQTPPSSWLFPHFPSVTSKFHFVPDLKRRGRMEKV